MIRTCTRCTAVKAGSGVFFAAAAPACSAPLPWETTPVARGYSKGVEGAHPVCRRYQESPWKPTPVPSSRSSFGVPQARGSMAVDWHQSFQQEEKLEALGRSWQVTKPCVPPAWRARPGGSTTSALDAMHGFARSVLEEGTPWATCAESTPLQACNVQKASTDPGAPHVSGTGCRCAAGRAAHLVRTSGSFGQALLARHGYAPVRSLGLRLTGTAGAT